MSNLSLFQEPVNVKGDADMNVKVDMNLDKDNKLDKPQQPHENAATTTESPPKVRKQLPTPKEVRINPHDLQYCLSQKLQEEERYQLINDAKIRAMTQGTASYEDFRQIWMAAHLRPLEKDDRLKSGTGSKVVWNPMVSKGKDKPSPSDEQVAGSGDDKLKAT